jgi:hypothetical protein
MRYSGIQIGLNLNGRNLKTKFTTLYLILIEERISIEVFSFYFEKGGVQWITITKKYSFTSIARSVSTILFRKTRNLAVSV